MSNISKWNPQIDEALRVLYEDQKTGNWASIADKLNQMYGQPIRHAKQCRQRYMNAIKFKGSNEIWSNQQNKILRQQFLSVGPKWVLISKKITGRGQNAIKNKFNAELRKSMRKMNSLCKTCRTKHRKPIETQWFRKLTKVVFEANQVCVEKVKYAKKLMAQFMEVVFSGIPDQESELQQESPYIKVLQNICTYNKYYLFSKVKKNAQFLSNNQAIDSVQGVQKLDNNVNKYSKTCNSHEPDQQAELIDNYSNLDSIVSQSLLNLANNKQLQNHILLDLGQGVRFISHIEEQNFEQLPSNRKQHFLDDFYL